MNFQRFQANIRVRFFNYYTIIASVDEKSKHTTIAKFCFHLSQRPRVTPGADIDGVTPRKRLKST